ncbi:MAG: zf-TFIIB domain-containing protein [Nitrospirae bacterium]|nr:zf-TFIIB domain-containing protein [Nitrospirota bacterium]
MNELVKCPQCGKDVNSKSALCPFCGGRTGDEKNCGSQICPRCGAPLESRLKNDIEIDMCPQCGGLWLDRGEFEVCTAESTVYREEKLTAEYSRPRLPDRIDYIPCVRCGKLMVRKNYGFISGVIIDECGRHGIWLDSGELEKIRQFILSGGMEKSQFREIEKNRQEIRDLAENVRDVAFTHKLIHFWNWKRWFFGP